MIVRALSLAAALLLAAPALAAEPESPSRHVTVTGEGEASARPDLAIVTIGVTTRAPSAGEALSQNNEAMSEVIAELRALGLGDRDLQTAGFSLSPQYEANRTRSDEPPRIVAYVASNSVLAHFRGAHLDSLGAALDKAVKAGSNTLGSIRFAVEDERALGDEARAAAVADAKRKATLLAEAAGATLGPVVSIVAGGAPPVPLGRTFRAMESMAAAAVPVELGETTIRETVSITYELR